jgi:ribosomal protein S27E
MIPNFKEVTAAARSLRTADAVLELIDAYATNGCGTYPADTELIREVFGSKAPEGYKFDECAGWAGGAADLVITRVSPPPTYPAILSHRRKHPDHPHIVVDVTCPGCDFSRVVGLAGWTAIVCGGCKAELSKPVRGAA